MSYLASFFHDHKRFWGFREIIEFVSRFSEVYWLADVWKRWRNWFVVWKCPNTAVKVRTIEIRQRFGLRGSDFTRWRTKSTRLSLPVNNERIDQMDWWAFLNMFKTTLQRLLIKLMNTGYLRVFALFYFANWDDAYNSLLSVCEASKMSCFVGSFSIEAHLVDVVLHGMWVLFSFLEF